MHNSCLTGVRMPWSYDADTLRRRRDAADLHARAVPLILRLWAEAVRTGLPVTRPLWLVDPDVGTVDDQWMLGADVVVAPVLAEGAVSRAVVLPAGQWRWQGTGPVLPGGRTVEVDAPLDVLPWFARAGSEPLRPPSRAGRPGR